jgi:transposase-like protein
MDGRALYDEATRRRAAALFEEGMGYKAAAGLLGIPQETVRKWMDVYRSVGIEVLAMMGKKHTAYSFETKLAAVRAVVDEGMTMPEAMAKFGIASPSSFKKWLKAYREEGPEALRPKPKGRPRGSGSPPKELTREQELERRIQKLEAENAYLKKSIALKAEKRSRTARKPRP